MDFDYKNKDENSECKKNIKIKIIKNIKKII